MTTAVITSYSTRVYINYYVKSHASLKDGLLFFAATSELVLKHVHWKHSEGSCWWLKTAIRKFTKSLEADVPAGLSWVTVLISYNLVDLVRLASTYCQPCPHSHCLTTLLCLTTMFLTQSSRRWNLVAVALNTPLFFGWLLSMYYLLLTIAEALFGGTI